MAAILFCEICRNEIPIFALMGRSYRKSFKLFSEFVQNYHVGVNIENYAMGTIVLCAI